MRPETRTAWMILDGDRSDRVVCYAWLNQVGASMHVNDVRAEVR